MQTIDNYKAPIGCPRDVLPARTLSRRDYYCLYSVREGHWYGQATQSEEEIIARADKENQRHRDYNLALQIPFKTD